jgi:hypothetical protein
MLVRATSPKLRERRHQGREFPQPPPLTKANKFICYWAFNPLISVKPVHPFSSSHIIMMALQTPLPPTDLRTSQCGVSSQPCEHQIPIHRRTDNGTKTIFPGISHQHNAKLGHLSSIAYSLDAGATPFEFLPALCLGR